MSYIIGWKGDNCVFLSGDIAITRNSKIKLRNSKSIFGNELINEIGKSINEECLKLIKINNKLITAFAGNVQAALEFINYLKMYTNESDNDLVAMIKFIAERYNSNNEVFSVFIGLIDKIGEARLFSFNLNNDYKLIEHEEPIQDGSLENSYRKLSSEFCNEISSKPDLTEDEILVIVNMYHQNLIIQEDLLKKGVGGIFSGIKINSKGVKWQKDTSIVLYQFKQGAEGLKTNNPEKLFDYTALINVVERDGFLRYSSPFPDDLYRREVIYNCLDIPRTISDFEKKKDLVINWHKKWHKKTNKIFNSVNTQYYCIISRTAVYT